VYEAEEEGIALNGMDRPEHAADVMDPGAYSAARHGLAKTASREAVRISVRKVPQHHHGQSRRSFGKLAPMGRSDADTA
jgi:hypothetical protein